jgi:hypothetical protein
MKIHKIFIVIIIFTAFFFAGATRAVRVDFLKKPSGLQPPPIPVNSGVLENENFKFSQNQQAKIPADLNSLHSAKTLYNVLPEKSTGHWNVFILVSVFFAIVILVAGIFLYANKKMNGTIK